METKYWSREKVAWLSRDLSYALEQFMLSGTDSHCAIPASARKALFEQYKRNLPEDGGQVAKGRYRFEVLSDCLFIAGITLNDFFAEIGYPTFTFTEREQSILSILGRVPQKDKRIKDLNCVLSSMLSEFWSDPGVTRLIPTHRVIASFFRAYSRAERRNCLKELGEDAASLEKVYKDRNFMLNLDDASYPAIIAKLSLSPRWVFCLTDKATAIIPNVGADIAFSRYMMLDEAGKAVIDNLLPRLFATAAMEG